MHTLPEHLLLRPTQISRLSTGEEKVRDTFQFVTSIGIGTKMDPVAPTFQTLAKSMLDWQSVPPLDVVVVPTVVVPIDVVEIVVVVVWGWVG